MYLVKGEYVKKTIYKARNFNLKNLEGISEKTLEVHFKLYEGYVKETNHLNELIQEHLSHTPMDDEELPAYAEIKRRLGFEYNGMVLHEYYFDNLQSDGSSSIKKNNHFFQTVETHFDSFEKWKTDFCNVGKMRGVGWAVCYQDPKTKSLTNHWINLHEAGNIAGYKPILVMDVWEHAFILDYKPSERKKYIDSFFANIAWDVVEQRLHKEIID